MKTVYLTGSLIGSEENRTLIDVQTELAKVIYEQGEKIRVVNPVSVFDDVDSIEEFTKKEIMKMRIDAMLSCDEVVMLDNYSTDNSCELEIDIARRVDMPVTPFVKFLYGISSQK